MAKNKQKNTEVTEELELDKQEELIDFDTWYGLREGLIPPHHYKEILRVDFKARKVPKLTSVEEFDMALKKYGVELKLT
jgi:hypothetical protein